MAGAANYRPADRYVPFELQPTEVRAQAYGDVPRPESRWWRAARADGPAPQVPM